MAKRTVIPDDFFAQCLKDAVVPDKQLKLLETKKEKGVVHISYPRLFASIHARYPEAKETSIRQKVGAVNKRLAGVRKFVAFRDPSAKRKKKDFSVYLFEV